MNKSSAVRVLNKLFEQHPLFMFVFLPFTLLIFHASAYWPFFSDDAFISLRYAERLLEGKGLTWTDGERVEGYSNLAWVMLCAGLGKLGLNLVYAARILGFICFLLVLYLNYRLWQFYSFKNNNSLFFAQIIFVFSAPIAIWSIGGLEQPLVAFSMVIAVYGMAVFLEVNSYRYVLLSSFGLAVLCLTRPDGPVFCVGLALGFWWSSGHSFKAIIKPVLILALLPVLSVGSQIAFRWFYYDALVPNTAYIKITPSLFHVLLGLRYLLTGFIMMLPLSYLFIYALKRDVEFLQLNLTRLILPSIIIWLIYLLMVGGDIFPGLRHFIVVISIALLIFPALLNSLGQLRIFQSGKNIFFISLFFLVLQYYAPTSENARIEKWEWEGEVLSNVLVKAFVDDQPLLAVTSAGAIPYFTGFPSIDMLGLNDRYIAQNPIGDPGKAFVGHGYANGPYVYERNPDIISFCVLGGEHCRSPLKPQSNASKQLFDIEGFFNKFLLVRLVGDHPFNAEGVFWFNKQSSKIGIEKLENKLVIPGYLLVGNVDENGYPNNIVSLNDNDKLGVIVNEEFPAWISLQSIKQDIIDVKVIASGEVHTSLIKESEGGVRLIVQPAESNQIKPIHIEKIELYL